MDTFQNVVDHLSGQGWIDSWSIVTFVQQIVDVTCLVVIFVNLVEYDKVFFKGLFLVLYTVVDLKYLVYRLHTYLLWLISKLLQNHIGHSIQ